MSNSWQASLQQATHNGTMTVRGLLKSRKLMYERSGRPAEPSWRATREIRLGFSHEETLHDGTAQSVANEVIPRDRSGRPDIDSQERAWPQQFVIGNDEAELEMSVELRSIVNRVNDQVRKREFQILKKMDKHSMIWSMCMAVTMESAVFMGKTYQNNCQSNVNTTDLTLKRMFDISTKLVSEQDEINGVKTIDWEHFHVSIVFGWWTSHQSSTHEGLRLFGFCVVPWEDSRKPLNVKMHGNKDWDGPNLLQNIETLTESKVSQWNSSGIFSRIQYVAAQWRSQKFIVEIRWDTGEFHSKDSIYVDVQRHFLWNKRQHNRMSGKHQTRISTREKTMVINWSWFWKEVVFYQWRKIPKETGTI